MAPIKSAPPSLIPAILALLVLALFGYLLLSDLQPKRTEHDVNPPIEIIETPPELTIIKQQSVDLNNAQIDQQEAEAFVNQLATASSTPVTVDENNDKFVRHDSIINLPKTKKQTTIQSLLADDTMTKETELTLHFVSKDKVETTLAELSDNISDHSTIVTIITTDGNEISKSLADFLADESIGLTTPITRIALQPHQKQTTIAELEQEGTDPNQPLFISIKNDNQQLSVKEILQVDDLSDDALFYLHRVTDDDIQGLWGIIQTGLINKFREGLRIEGISSNKELVQAIIPANADEKLPSGLSSFLGTLLQDKVDNSYIYNFNTQTMGYDSNLVHPGQQLIMIHFSPEELIQVYTFFSKQRNQGTEAFAIGD